MCPSSRGPRPGFIRDAGHAGRERPDDRYDQLEGGLGPYRDAAGVLELVAYRGGGTRELAIAERPVADPNRLAAVWVRETGKRGSVMAVLSRYTL